MYRPTGILVIHFYYVFTLISLLSSSFYLTLLLLNVFSDIVLNDILLPVYMTS